MGNIPGYAAFDGANVWVTNLLDNTVSKLRASDGINLGNFPTGKFPWVIAFDGSSIWVASNGIPGNTVTKLRASDGAALGTFTVGNSAFGVAFDGPCGVRVVVLRLVDPGAHRPGRRDPLSGPQL